MHFRLKYLLNGLIALMMHMIVVGQPVNDECTSAISLDLVLGNVCTEVGAHSSTDATPSMAVPRPTCLFEDLNDVWFSFRAVSSTVGLTINGQTSIMPGGDLRGPAVSLYEGQCGSLMELACNTDQFNANSVTTIEDGLTIGAIYYIRVAGVGGATGTFQICINSYNLVPDPQSDCSNAVLLCDKSPYSVERLAGTGLEPNELANYTNLCLPTEQSSAWYKWTAGTDGTLTFTITPDNPGDDFDFVLFEMDDPNDCSSLTPVRCMASGQDAQNDWSACVGPTGLREGESDVSEPAGCPRGSNAFLAPLDMVAGHTYALLINNYSESGQGFSIDFGGTGEFIGPEITLDIVDGQNFDEIECDKSFTLQEQIIFASGSIDEIAWSFGVDATPATATGPGPHSVVYSSIGLKTVSVTVTTNNDCITTEFIEIDVLPCCEDFTDFNIEIEDVQHPLCYGDATGMISVNGVGGEPFYEFSLDSMTWTNNTVFTGLEAGVYRVFIRDRKGCVRSVEVEISQNEALQVDAGADQVVCLGCEAIVETTIKPLGATVTYTWTSTDPTFVDPGTSGFRVMPPGETVYTITVQDTLGCKATDEVILTTDDYRPIYVPTAFSPNNDGINDYFTVYGNRATRNIELLEIYDRWGSKIFERKNIMINEPLIGWDGTKQGEVLDPGTFVYLAKVRFVDDVVRIYSGEIHLIK